MKEKVLSLEEIEKRYFEEKLNRLREGYPLKFRRTKPRDPRKREAMVKWLLRVIPPAEDILSGKAFEELFRR
ncbi:MAG: hypothetical protein KNN13_04645 [Hydrogenobacter thermophilus]|uniref:hypothetical protein n=1 Tax=Hydrogenobacter thermophilus TaxID=940 RepID=UPI001C772358|nr:hypothetical protein [Hydrogenobacter thermophilus]QWK20610.1 MAG: hypothetical protein KNN13_04645 [Hydrogenobacter thermophilus]